ncbi:MAG: hypothetical protein KGJ06_07720, partial [Pseudomonadota bacterium]|nr:hypothetical protein [Pseudomonadota bacterium]
MIPDNRLTVFKQALTSATRALAARRHLDVQFGKGEGISLPPMAELPSPHALPLVRGEADHAALRLRYHDEGLHRKLRPAGAAPGTAFDLLEEIRMEALGGEHLHGVQHNLARRFEQHCMQKNLRPDALPLMAALELYARHYVQGMEVPAFLAAVLDRPDMQMQPILPKLAELRGQLADQRKYAALALALIDTLSHTAQPLERGDNPGEKSLSESTAQAETQEAEASIASPGAPEESADSAASMKVKAGGALGEETAPRGEETRTSRPSPYPYNHEEETPP